MPTGLKGRLTLMVAIVALIALTALTAGFNLLLRSSLDSDADRVLSARLAAALDGVVVKGGRVVAAESAEGGVGDSGTWVYSGDKLIDGPASAPAVTAVANRMASGEASSEAEVGGQDLRLAMAPVVAADGRQIGAVVASLNVGPYEHSAKEALLTSALLALGMFLLIVVMTRLVVNRALKPVAVMTEEAADWSEHDLDHRFNLGPPTDELTALASTFDSMLARLAETLRREQRLTAEISHELRTPLAAVAAEAELALRRNRTDEEYRQALEGIHRRSRQLAEIVDTLMAAARDHTLLSGESAYANEAARRAIAGLELGADAAPVELVPVPGNPSVQAGLAVAGQVIAPLLENACRHGASPITLTVTPAGDAVAFEVRDRGPGIPDDDLERIFEPGYRGAAAGSDEQGAGLGLALARRLARTLGGDVVAIPSDSGALLRATLPRAEAH